MNIITIASGSTGNCTLITDKGTALLIDAGISAKRICTALSDFGLSPESLSGILITHEHSDHIKGLEILLKHHEIPIYAPRTVANRLRGSIAGAYDYIADLTVMEESSVGGLKVTPFHTPHDTPESVGYRISGSRIFGLCTDCGHLTDEIMEGLTGADIALIEANHNVQMLMDGGYPPMLKRRILSDNGHLSNENCGVLAARLFNTGTRRFVLGHLSRENNTPRRAFDEVGAYIAREGADLKTGLLSVAPESEYLEVCSDGSN